jgi:hypothetical protein
LHQQFVGGALASVGLLVEKARKIFFADIERRMVISLLAVDADGNQAVKIWFGIHLRISEVTFWLARA